MMKQEFEKRIGLVITNLEYEPIEQAYMGLPESVGKDKFVKIWLENGGIQDLFDKRAATIQCLKDGVIRLEENLKSESHASAQWARDFNNAYKKVKALEEKLAAIAAMTAAA